MRRARQVAIPEESPGLRGRPGRLRAGRVVCVLLVALGVLHTAETALAEDAATDFARTCTGCHTIGGGRLTGPDLKDVTTRQDRAWLIEFIMDPNSVLDSKDPYALKLLEEARNARMSPIGGMSRDRAGALLDLIEAESAKPVSRFKGFQTNERPFTPGDVEDGRRLFTGLDRLRNGNAACIGCHTLGGLGALGGGRLGPDLTRVFERYQDRRRLGAWLNAPTTETMLPTYFKEVALTQQEDTAPRALAFVFLGLSGAVAVLLLMGFLWRGRFHSVRSQLVQAACLRSEEVGGDVEADAADHRRHPQSKHRRGLRRGTSHPRNHGKGR